MSTIPSSCQVAALSCQSEVGNACVCCYWLEQSIILEVRDDMIPIRLLVEDTCNQHVIEQNAYTG